MAEFQTRIREFRQAKGMSTRELADKLGTSQPNLTRMETGSQAVTVEWLHKIGYVLGVSPAALIDFDTAYATIRGDLRPDRKEWPLFTAEQIYTVPVPMIGSGTTGKPLDAFQIGERELIFCDRAQHFDDEAKGKRFVLHIRDAAGNDGLCLCKFTDDMFGAGFTHQQGIAYQIWIGLWDDAIQKKWRVVAEFKGE